MKKKNTIIFIITFIFVFFFMNAILLINKDSMFNINILKKTSNYVNSYFISKMYSVPNNSNYVLNMKIKALTKENDNLKKILEFKKERNDVIPAYVTNSLNKVLTNKIYIKTNKKIKEEDIIINENGLIGFVKRTSNFISQVDLINGVDENNSFAVFIKSGNNNILGVLSEYDKKKNLFKVKDIITNNDIKENDEVVLKENESIYIGSVVRQEYDEENLSKIVWIKSNVDFDNLLYVLVVEK